MKIKNLKELKNKELKELNVLVAKKKLDLMKNAVKIAMSKEKNLKTAWVLKKEIAQILTIIKSKE